VVFLVQVWNSSIRQIVGDNAFQFLCFPSDAKIFLVSFLNLVLNIANRILKLNWFETETEHVYCVHNSCLCFIIKMIFVHVNKIVPCRFYVSCDLVTVQTLIGHDYSAQVPRVLHRTTPFIILGQKGPPILMVNHPN